MDIETLLWATVVGLFLVWWRLGTVLDGVRDIAYKTEYWGRENSDLLREIKVLAEDAVSNGGDIRDIASRLEEHFPTERELEHKAETNT